MAERIFFPLTTDLLLVLFANRCSLDLATFENARAFLAGAIDPLFSMNAPAVVSV